MARPADYLLIDVSNSFTKLALATPKAIGRPVRIPTAKLSSARLKRHLRGKQIGHIVACSVVPRKNAELERGAGATKILWLTPRLDLGVTIDFPHPNAIGADRLANAAAVTKLYGAPAIVVDFGTAVTFDIISSAKAYIGGVIAPGLEAMTNFLYQRTALLPRISLHEPRSAIGKSTREAMMAGAVFGYRGLVNEIIAQIKRAPEFRRANPRIVATGGYAKLIARRVPAIDVVHPNLTLEGLRLVANANLKPSAD